MSGQAHPCRDCETGACPCGATCEGCDFTGRCSSCRGYGFVEGPPPRAHRWEKPHAHPRTRWGRKPPMPECPGCGRAHKCDSAYYEMSPEQVLALVRQTPGVRDRPRCTVCCVPFGSPKSRWLAVARERGCTTGGAFGKLKL